MIRKKVSLDWVISDLSLRNSKLHHHFFSMLLFENFLIFWFSADTLITFPPPIAHFSDEVRLSSSILSKKVLQKLARNGLRFELIIEIKIDSYLTEQNLR